MALPKWTLPTLLALSALASFPLCVTLLVSGWGLALVSADTTSWLKTTMVLVYGLYLVGYITAAGVIVSRMTRAAAWSRRTIVALGGLLLVGALVMVTLRPPLTYILLLALPSLLTLALVGLLLVTLVADERTADL